jgi:hypothetical protein
LNEAVTKENKTILHSIKKPLLHFNETFGLVDLKIESGTIDEE